MLLACKVAVRVTERARTAYLSMLVMCLCIRLCIRLIFVKINSYICVNKKEKHLASPYVYVNLMLQGCQIKYLASSIRFTATSKYPSSISIPMKFLLVLTQATPVLPEPKVKSNTVSPSCV